MQVSNAAPEGAPRVIFAALDAGIARELEPQFAAAGCAVVSNSSAFRMHENVPLVVPEVNAGHIALIEKQCWRKQSGGYIVTNPNCSAIGLVVALAPLHQKFGIESLFVTTMQAVSGAGYPGVASLDILGNVIPYIAKEEEKMEEETRKLLGQLAGDRVEPATFRMTAHCNRVAVEDGHTESVSVKLKRKAEAEELIAAFNEFRSTPQELKLPLAPAQPIFYDAAPDRPQPRFDVDRGQRDDGERGTASSLRRARLQVHCALAQHHSWRRWRRPSQRRTPQGAGLPVVTRELPLPSPVVRP